MHLASPVTVPSPAKLNLHLRVAGPIEGGYHPLRSWMVSIGLFDKLSFAIEKTDAQPGDASDAAAVDPIVRLTCDDPRLPTDETNLIVKAARRLQLAAPERWPRGLCISIHLQKRIPTGGGLGGGSGNAAVTIRALNAILSLGLSTVQLRDVCKHVGSDVSFFLTGGSAIVSGLGGIVEPCQAPSASHALLVFPEFGVSTQACYQRLDAIRPVVPGDTLDEFDVRGWSKMPSTHLLQHLVNDLEPPAFDLEPRLAQIRADLELQLTRPVRMSGSGSTLFTLFDSFELDLARALANKLAASHRCQLVELLPVI
jgi:4-diphosphocytidyl-2-C-methyl-D-erythritol kinase